jgi:hypothetical protein
MFRQGKERPTDRAFARRGARKETRNARPFWSGRAAKKHLRTSPPMIRITLSAKCAGEPWKRELGKSGLKAEWAAGLGLPWLWNGSCYTHTHTHTHTHKNSPKFAPRACEDVDRRRTGHVGPGGTELATSDGPLGSAGGAVPCWRRPSSRAAGGPCVRSAAVRDALRPFGPLQRFRPSSLRKHPAWKPARMRHKPGRWGAYPTCPKHTRKPAWHLKR